MVNSKNKGGRFERSIAKLFENWTGYKFSRTPGSGGWAKAKDAMGDLVCVDEKHGHRFPFSIECKFHKEINFEHVLLGNKKCKILEFWEQARRDAIRADKVPVLIMKYNGMPKDEAFVVLNKPTFFGVPDIDTAVQKTTLFYIFKPDHSIKEESLIVIMLSDFLNINYKKWYKILRKQLKDELPF